MWEESDSWESTSHANFKDRHPLVGSGIPRGVTSPHPLILSLGDMSAFVSFSSLTQLMHQHVETMQTSVIVLSAQWFKNLCKSIWNKSIQYEQNQDQSWYKLIKPYTLVEIIWKVVRVKTLIWFTIPWK
jgi:hypothetical protein